MKKALFFIITFILLGTVAWYFFIRMDKKKALNIIVAAKSGRTIAEFSSFEEGFLIAWAKALNGAKTDFVYNGKTYNADTAKAI